jgi:hypothetical protein
VGPAPGWGQVQTGGRDPGGPGSSSMAKGQVFQHGVSCMAQGWYPAMCGSRTELWPGGARGVESPAEWSSGSAELQGGDLAGCLF